MQLFWGNRIMPGLVGGTGGHGASSPPWLSGAAGPWVCRGSLGSLAVPDFLQGLCRQVCISVSIFLCVCVCGLFVSIPVCASLCMCVYLCTSAAGRAQFTSNSVPEAAWGRGFFGVGHRLDSALKGVQASRLPLFLCHLGNRMLCQLCCSVRLGLGGADGEK